MRTFKSNISLGCLVLLLFSLLSSTYAMAGTFTNESHAMTSTQLSALADEPLMHMECDQLNATFGCDDSDCCFNLTAIPAAAQILTINTSTPISIEFHASVHKAFSLRIEKPPRHSSPV